MIVLVTGDRNWDNGKVVLEALREHTASGDTLIHGAARGADTQCGNMGAFLGLHVLDVPADWRKYGRSAGPRRNIQMLDMNPDIVLAFHDNLTDSKGTKHCVREALKRGIPVYLYSASGYVMRPSLSDVT